MKVTIFGDNFYYMGFFEDCTYYANSKKIGERNNLGFLRVEYPFKSDYTSRLLYRLLILIRYPPDFDK